MAKNVFMNYSAVGVGVIFIVADGEAPPRIPDPEGVGETKIIFIVALSSGIGETIFLPANQTPATTTASTIKPTMMAMAANVFCRSVICLL